LEVDGNGITFILKFKLGKRIEFIKKFKLFLLKLFKIKIIKTKLN